MAAGTLGAAARNKDTLLPVTAGGAAGPCGCCGSSLAPASWASCSGRLVVPESVWAVLQRPDIQNNKTMAPEWRALRSRWRWLHAAFFYIGPPVHIWSRIWPLLTINMTPVLVIAADHIVRILSADGGDPGGRAGFLPEFRPALASSLVPMFHFLLFPVSLFITLRLTRAYDRWWTVRTKFHSIGGTVLKLIRGLTASLGREPEHQAYIADVRRWGVVWQFAVMQLCTDAEHLHPDAAKLLHPDELALYAASKKGRQFALNRLTQLLADAPIPIELRVLLGTALHKGSENAGVCGIIHTTAMPLALSLVAAGFSELFLLLLPLTHLHLDQGVGSVPAQRAPAVAATCFLVFVNLCINLLVLGAEETALSLEDPIPYVPMYAIARTTAADSERAILEAAALRRVPGQRGEPGWRPT